MVSLSAADPDDVALWVRRISAGEMRTDILDDFERRTLARFSVESLAPLRTAIDAHRAALARQHRYRVRPSYREARPANSCLAIGQTQYRGEPLPEDPTKVALRDIAAPERVEVVDAAHLELASEEPPRRRSRSK